MPKPADLTTEARAGFEGKPNPHIYTSPAWYAHALGNYLRVSGRTEPTDVRMSRGASVRVRDMIFQAAVTNGQTGEAVFERVQ